MSEQEGADPERRAEAVPVEIERRPAFGGQAFGGTVVTHPSSASPPRQVSFDRRELQTILNLYGRRVAEGEWRDYAIDFSPTKAVFAIFRRASETPLYTVEKNPELARRQGAYSVVASSGLILKRGHDLERVLSVLDRKLKLVT